MGAARSGERARAAVQDALDLSAAAPEPEAPRSEVQGNVLGGMANFLASFGVVAVEERDDVEEAVAAELLERGHEAQVVKLRYATLYLQTTAQAARFLRYDVAGILAGLATRVPGKVDNIVVRVAR